MATTAPAAALVRDLTAGQTVTVAGITGTVVEVRAVPRSRVNVSLIMDVGGERMDLRTRPDNAVTVVDASAAPSARAEDHKPVWEDAPLGTRCSCGWKPEKRATASSRWHLAYNRHARSLGLLGI